jgi:glycosyltransferase involved in cell wall biosynthesis
MDKNPLVSIIIPVYNGSNYVAEAIDSALSQTYKNIEVLVINDGSKDNGETEKIALSYGDKIRYFHKENGGVSSTLNLGIREMKGEYFSWLSHDDKYGPDKIQNQVDHLSAIGFGKNVAYCNSRQIDKNSQFFKTGKTEDRFLNRENVGWEKALKSLFNAGCYNGCSFLIPKTVFDEVGGFDEKLRYTQDMLMWIKIFIHGYGMIYGAETDSFMRVHGGQLTQTGRAMFVENSEKMSEWILPELSKVSTKQNNLLYYYAKYNARYAIKNVYKQIINLGKSEKQLSLLQRIKLCFIALYGNLRPFIRKIYYRLFKKVKTQ